jgi:predicted negative regulator of RcsB-dependent stress response
MSKDLNFDLKQVMPKIKSFWTKISKHLPFILIIAALFVFLFVVWRIKSYAIAEPSDEAVNTAEMSTKVPKIDQKAISQIQSLEDNSPEVHSLFNQARNNPFRE